MIGGKRAQYGENVRCDPWAVVEPRVGPLITANRRWCNTKARRLRKSRPTQQADTKGTASKLVISDPEVGQAVRPTLGDRNVALPCRCRAGCL